MHYNHHCNHCIRIANLKYHGKASPRNNYHTDQSKQPTNKDNRDHNIVDVRLHPHNTIIIHTLFFVKIKQEVFLYIRCYYKEQAKMYSAPTSPGSKIVVVLFINNRIDQELNAARRKEMGYPGLVQNTESLWGRIQEKVTSWYLSKQVYTHCEIAFESCNASDYPSVEFTDDLDDQQCTNAPAEWLSQQNTSSKVPQRSQITGGGGGNVGSGDKLLSYSVYSEKNGKGGINCKLRDYTNKAYEYIYLTVPEEKYNKARIFCALIHKKAVYDESGMKWAPIWPVDNTDKRKYWCVSFTITVLHQLGILCDYSVCSLDTDDLVVLLRHHPSRTAGLIPRHFTDIDLSPMFSLAHSQ